LRCVSGREEAIGLGSRTGTHLAGGKAITLVADPPVDMVDGLEVAEGMGAFSHYGEDSVTRTKELLLGAAMNEGFHPYVAMWENTVVGYVNIIPPNPSTRWGKLGVPGILELDSMEVAREWRGLGVMSALLRFIFEGGEHDARVVFSTEYTWHWDVEGSGLDKEEYRKRLLGVLGNAGFREYWTDEPNVRMDPDNAFTARIGADVDESLRTAFLLSLYEEQGLLCSF